MICDIERRSWHVGLGEAPDVASLLEVFSFVVLHLAPLLTHPYTIESCVMRYLGDLQQQVRTSDTGIWFLG
jgi:hypothetical protein